MKMINALLVGSAAALVGFSAQAADLPKKSAPAEFVRVCQGQGADFFIIPGSDTCLKIGGSVRLDVWANSNQFGGPTRATLEGTNTFGTGARATVNFDARTATSMGTLRSYTELQFRRGGATSSSQDPIIGSGNAQTSRSSLASLNSAFVQFAGFTAGLAATPFAFGGYNGIVGPIANVTGLTVAPAGLTVAQLSYTATLGNGLSAAVGLVDSAYTRQAALATVLSSTNAYVFGGVGGAGVINAASSNDGIIYGGNNVPDVVANINLTQAWGSAQLMGALHHLRGVSGVAATAVNVNTGFQGSFQNNAGSSYGYAVGAGLLINLPVLGAGSTLWGQAVYSSGANTYAFYNIDSDGINVSRNSYAFKSIAAKYSDAIVNAAGTGFAKTNILAVHGGLRAVFSPQWQAGLFAGYTDINSPSDAFFGNNLSDIKIMNVGANITYSPVRNLNLSLEGIYVNAKASSSGTTTTHTAGVSVLAAPSAIASQNENTFIVGARVQRNF